MVNRRRVGRTGTAPPFRSDDGRWQELIGIAARIFARKGYRSTTLQDIADEFGVLKGSLYHYIRGKEDLLFEVVRSVYGRGLENLRAAADADLDPLDRLRAAVRGHVLHLVDTLVETTVLLHEFDQLSARRRAEIPLHDYQELIRGLVADAMTDDRVKPDLDPQLVALAVLGATNWVYRWYRPDGTRTPREIADQFAELLVDGMLLRPDASTGTRAGAAPVRATG